MLFNHLETTEELGVGSLGNGDFHSLDACDRVVRADADSSAGDGDRSPAVVVGAVFKGLGGAGGGG